MNSSRSVGTTGSGISSWVRCWSSSGSSRRLERSTHKSVNSVGVEENVSGAILPPLPIWTVSRSPEHEVVDVNYSAPNSADCMPRSPFQNLATPVFEKAMPRWRCRHVHAVRRFGYHFLDVYRQALVPRESSQTVFRTGSKLSCTWSGPGAHGDSLNLLLKLD